MLKKPEERSPTKEERERLRQYLVSDGKEGFAPDWYKYIQVARYLQVPITEIEKAPQEMREYAETVLEASNWLLPEDAQRWRQGRSGMRMPVLTDEALDAIKGRIFP